MPTDNVAEFPGTPIRGAGFDYEVHWTLSEALRESARQGFERKLKGLWARYASPRWKEHPFGRPDFLDSALLVAREQHYFEGRTWRDSFRYVVQIVTSKPECERIEGIAWIQAYRIEYNDEIVGRLANLPDPRSHDGPKT